MKPIVLSLLLALLLPLAAMAQLPNGDFEDNNDTVPAQWSIYDFGSGVRTDYAHSGSHSLAVWNWYYYSKGYAVNGTMGTGWLGGYEGAGTPTTDKALRLTGYYYYDTTGTDTNNDSAIITIAFRKRDAVNNVYDTVAYGMQYFLPTTGSSMVPFSIPIVDLAPGADPDTVVVVLQSSLNGFCDAANGGNCLYFYVDNLKLESTTGVADIMRQFQSINIHPNPAANTVTVVAETDGAAWNLYDLSGKLIHTAILPRGENQVDVSAHPAGLYLVELAQNGTVLGREKLVKQ